MDFLGWLLSVRSMIGSGLSFDDLIVPFLLDISNSRWFEYITVSLLTHL